MVRQVADKLASLFRDENIKVICVLGGPYVGKTWLVNHILETEKCNGIKVFDNVNTYEEFEVHIRDNRKVDDRYIIVGRLSEARCKEIVGKDLIAEYVVLYPMNFSEFRLTIPVGYNLNQREMLNIYMLVGGLPEVVKYFLQTGDINLAKEKQRQLFGEIRCDLSVKARNVVDEVIKQELAESTGFCLRQINGNARDREYGAIIDELVDMGVIARIDRLMETNDIDMRKYKLQFYDVGIYSMVVDLGIDNFNKELLYDFYYKELRTYINSENQVIKYWKKNRAKAKLSIIVENKDKEKRFVSISLEDKEWIIPRSVHSFRDEYPSTIHINVQMPILDKVIDGRELYDKISHNT